jgi:hypothetical protein
VTACPRAATFDTTDAATDTRTAAADSFCEGGGTIFAHGVTLRTRIDTSTIGSFARLTPLEQRRLDGLLRLPDMEYSVLVMGPRLLLDLPASHPAGAMQILLDDDQDRLVVFLPDKRLRAVLDRDRLPDLLDGASLASERSRFELEVSPSAVTDEEKRSTRVGTKTRAYEVQVALRYFPEPEKTSSWPLRLGLRLLTPDELMPFLFEPQLLQIALPLLQSDEGLELLDAMARRTGPPLGWSITVANEEKSKGTAPAVRTTVVDRGMVKVPLSTLCTTRPGYGEARPPLREDRTGLQLVSQAKLSRLREGRTGGPLTVRNRSPYAAQIYVDGVLVGWAASGREVALVGLPEGFYQVYARSPTGLRSWGPFETYVPGPLTLR